MIGAGAVACNLNAVQQVEVSVLYGLSLLYFSVACTGHSCSGDGADAVAAAVAVAAGH